MEDLMKRCQKCNIPLEGVVSKLLGAARLVSRSKEDPSLCNRCVKENKKKDYTCQICDRAVDEATALTHIKAEEYLLELIRKDHPEWKEDNKACPKCVEYYRELIKKAKI